MWLLLCPPAHPPMFGCLVPAPPRGAWPAASLESQRLEMSQGDVVPRAKHCPVPPTVQLCQHESSPPPAWAEWRVPPASPTELPPQPIAKPSSSPGCQTLHRYRCRISGVIPRVTLLKALLRSSKPGWKPSWSAAPAPLTSHTAHLLLFSLTLGPARATACLSCPRAVARGLGGGKSRPHLSVGLLPIFPGVFRRSKSHHMKKFKLVPQQRQE